ncbi:MAG TPA: hypothetical protein VHF26_15735 [Trebonia sp.]|nr:hypothetical protein [Trebonia sp.]
MKRVITVTATLAVAAGAATSAAVVPALAAQRPAAAHHAAQAKAAGPARPAPQAAPNSGAANSDAVNIGSELDGKYVTTVSCHGTDTPAPITAGQPGTPLTVHGTGPSAAILSMLAKPNSYKTVYVCTVVVRQKPVVAAPAAVCEIGGTTRPMPANGRCTAKKVTLNTGFGGEAGKVAAHHPAG